MIRYQRNDSQTVNLVEEEEAESPSVFINNCAHLDIGVQEVHNGDVIIQQEIKRGQNNLTHINNLSVNGEQIKQAQYKHKEQPKWIMLILGFIFFLALLIGVLVVVMVFLSDSTLNIFPDIKTYPKSNIMMNSELDYPTDKGICIVNRNEWEARPPTELLRQQKLPLERVIITHTGTESCYTREDCRSSMRIIQRFDIKSLGFFDTIYNFLIGGDGCVYIGRGWDYYGSHTRQYNMKTLGIGLIGTFKTMPPTASQLNVTLKLIDLGIKLGKLTQDYILTASCQLRPTLSPGKLVYDVISKWDHFNVSIETPPCTFEDIKIDKMNLQANITFYSN